MSLDPFHRGLPSVPDELSHFVDRFHLIVRLKLIVAYGLGKKFMGDYYPSIGNVSEVVGSVFKVHSENLESLHILWVKRLSFEFPGTGFPKLKRFHFSSSDNTPCEDPHDHIFRVFAESPKLERFEYRNIWPLHSASFAVESLVKKTSSFQQLCSLILHSRLTVEAFYNILQHCHVLEYLKVDKAVSVYEEVLLTDYTCTLAHLNTLTVTFVDSFFTDNSVVSLFSRLPSICNLNLTVVPPITVVGGFNFDHFRNSWVTDVGICVLTASCPLLKTLKLDLPLVINSEGFLEGFHHLHKLHLGKGVKLTAGKDIWMANIKSGCPKLNEECLIVEASVQEKLPRRSLRRRN